MSTDSDIVRRSIEDPAAFGELFDRHAAAIHRYVARRTDSAVADDVMAQTFLVAFERRTTFLTDSASAAPWLYGIATNLVRRHRRDEARMIRALQRSAEPGNDPDTAGRVDERIDADREVLALATTLKGMPRARRDVLLLYAWADLTYEQIAEALGLPVGTVRSRLSRARADLRDAAPRTPAEPVAVDTNRRTCWTR